MWDLGTRKGMESLRIVVIDCVIRDECEIRCLITYSRY